VFSLEEDWAFEMMPKPNIAIILVYKLGRTTRDIEIIQSKGQDASLGLPVNDYLSKSIKFVKQYSDNACGTVALLHLLFNLDKCDTLKENGTIDHQNSTWLKKYLDNNPGATAEVLGRHIETDNELNELHENISQQGVTRQVDETDNHFILLLPIDGHILEFDGRKNAPIDHGKYEKGEFLKTCCKDVIKGRILKYVSDEDSKTLSCLQVSLKTEGKDEDQ